MRLLLIAALAACLLLVNANAEATADLQKEVESMKSILSTVSNQLMMQQYMLEERVRASGRSGIKAVRIREIGTRPYHLDSFSSFGMGGLHEHANNIRTVGMGEFTAVLNGIEFKTRHNDYRLYMPHPTDMTYGKVAEVPFPPTPPSVLNKKSLPDQIAEMQDYFRAWRDQNKTHRDYTDYFKPVLCYLEGAWTKSGKAIEEPFESDRHFIDAKSWMELQQKARFVSYSGSKSRNENLASLPTTIINMINGSIPEFAQFNFRILCHPLKQEVPLNRLRVVDDLHLRVNRKRSLFKHERSRAARFMLGPSGGKFVDGKFNRGFLDDLMAEIPGKNNYPGYFTDDGLDMAALDWKTGKEMDVSRYHRVYKIGGRDATGISIVNRGFNDDNMFVAMTNHSKVAGMSVKKRARWVNGKRIQPVLNQKWTYAVPLEIIYLTPLQAWNPYNIPYRGDQRSDSAKSVQANGRNGGCSPSKALNGTHSKLYYITPANFFGHSHSSSSADTARGSMCFLDGKGEVRSTQASGIRSFLPSIADIGSLRIRYPIFPIHDEGSTAWKELAALKQLVMDKDNYGRYYAKDSDEEETGDTYWQLTPSRVSKENVTPHIHNLILTRSQLTSIKFGVRLTLYTDVASGHNHKLELGYDANKNVLFAYSCDGTKWYCLDGHKSFLNQVNATDV